MNINEKIGLKGSCLISTIFETDVIVSSANQYRLESGNFR